MARICYFYIFEFRGVHNVGISLDARYTYEVDARRRKIAISRNPDYKDGFWGDGIDTLSAIVGNNGAGKTTSLLYMLEVFAEGSGEKDIKAMIVYENSNGLHVYQPTGKLFKVETESGLRCFTTNIYPHIYMFYYSGYFHTYQNVHEPGDGELAGVYNASDTWRLIKDYQDYANVDAISGTNTIAEHMDALRAQNDNRIVQLLLDEELRKLLPHTAVPRYIIIEKNDSGRKRLLHDQNRRRKEEINLYYPQFGASKDAYLADIVSANLYNIGAELGMPTKDIRGSVERWEDHYQNVNSVLPALSSFLNEPYPAAERILEVQKIIRFLYEACGYNERSEKLYIDIQDPKSRENLERLSEYFRDRSFVVAHYFDLSYSHVTSSSTRLSSGEYDMLKFFSRLNDSIYESPDHYANLVSPQLILIDEAENSYHPEWQRKYIHILTRFLEALYYRKKIEKFQVVITTHSPIILSDIPRECITYLEKSPRYGTVKESKDQPETFGTNVFELYRHSFFMSDGLVGEYASKKIEKLQREIQLGRKPFETLKHEIDIIGDEKIKAYFYMLLEKNNSQQGIIAYYENKIKEMQSGK